MMWKIQSVGNLTFVFFMLFPASVLAHHGLDNFDRTKLLHIEGKVVGFNLQDPHSLLFVDVENRDGSVTFWMIEGGAASGAVAAGLSMEFLATGPQVRVTAYPSKSTSCNPRCLASGIDFDFER